MIQWMNSPLFKRFESPQEFLKQDIAVRRLYLSVYYPTKAKRNKLIKAFVKEAMAKRYSIYAISKVIKRVFLLSDSQTKRLVNNAK